MALESIIKESIMYYDNKFTQTEIDRAIRKVEIAIDKMVDIQDWGFGNYKTQEILDRLNSLNGELVSSKPKDNKRT